MVRSWLATVAIRSARSFGRLLGCELVVEASDHSLETTMELPNRNTRAWDGSLYKHGQLFAQGYANPIKPAVNHNPSLETPDTINVHEGNPDEDDGEDDEEPGRVKLIASERYQQFMQQDLVSQLLNPREQWRLLVYGIIGLGALQFFTIIITLYATGGF